ncbi:MAG: hemolysin III family protein [Proteobacteria bacterium]|nr:hemolysin III family protein [Pseudomonadota bacterium]
MSSAYVFHDYSRWERRLDAVLHGFGLVGTIVGGALLLAFAQPGTWFPIVLYILGLAATYTASTAYHAAKPGRSKEVLRRLDHAMIFVMIAGSYAPYALISLWDHGGLWLEIGIGIAAMVGVALKLVFPRRLEWLGLLLYIGMGWAVVGAIGPLMDAVPTATLILLVIGGVLYTVGTVFHSLKNLPFHNVAWHTLVLGGAATHYAAAVIAFA